VVCHPGACLKPLLFVDDVLFQGQEQGRQFLLFFLWYLEFVENLTEDFQRAIPIGFGDAGAGVRGFHVAAGIDARATGGSVQSFSHI
jgi:hypothetical protein